MNKFAAVMARETDEELIRIVTVLRDDYQPLAIQAAEEEIHKRSIPATTVEEVKTVFAEEIEKEEYIEAGEAGSMRRLVHYIIDKPFILLISLIVFVGCSAISELLELVFNVERLMDPILVGMLYYSILFISYPAYYVFMEFYFQKTLGKYLTKTTVVTKEGNKPEFNAILKRTLYRLIPFDVFSYLFSPTGFHDRLSDTRVISDQVEE